MCAARGDKYTPGALEKLAQFSSEDFLALPATYGGKSMTISGVHASAEKQLARYIDSENIKQADTAKLPVLAFAGTRVAKFMLLRWTKGANSDGEIHHRRRKHFLVLVYAPK